jgi:hypothetical protein
LEYIPSIHQIRECQDGIENAAITFHRRNLLGFISGKMKDVFAEMTDNGEDHMDKSKVISHKS